MNFVFQVTIRRKSALHGIRQRVPKFDFSYSLTNDNFDKKKQQQETKLVFLNGQNFRKRRNSEFDVRSGEQVSRKNPNVSAYPLK